MSEFSGILNIGRTALLANQSAIAVTAQNQANINTPGYSRQVPIFVASYPGKSEAGPIGTGVEIGEIRQVVDRFVETQLLGGQASLGGYQIDRRVLSQIESLFNGSQGTGLQQALNEFFGAVQDLSNNPQGATERMVLLSKSRALAQQFSTISGHMRQIREDLNSDVIGTIDTVNGLAARIAQLNRTIGDTESGGGQANDLRDERGRLLNELAAEIDISVIEGDQGQATVTAAGGKPLVLGGQAFSLRGVADPLNAAFVNVEFVSGAGTATDITPSLSGGRLASLVDLRDRAVPDTMDRLDQLASGIITEFNTQHRLGFDLNGTPGGDFFTPTGAGASAAGTMAVAIVDSDLVAAASAAGAPGDNGNALRLAQLQNASVASLANTSFQDFYSSLVGVVGAESQAADWNLTAQESIVAQLSMQRESVSGVSLDEELANMIKFQRAYQAAAKLISTADEMMQTILDMKR
jgi:flagellar hook-associated protein 1 FlgK